MKDVEEQKEELEDAQESWNTIIIFKYYQTYDHKDGIVQSRLMRLVRKLFSRPEKYKTIIADCNDLDVINYLYDFFKYIIKEEKEFKTVVNKLPLTKSIANQASLEITRICLEVQDYIDETKHNQRFKLLGINPEGDVWIQIADQAENLPTDKLKQFQYSAIQIKDFMDIINNNFDEIKSDDPTSYDSLKDMGIYELTSLVEEYEVLCDEYHTDSCQIDMIGCFANELQVCYNDLFDNRIEEELDVSHTLVESLDDYFLKILEGLTNDEITEIVQNKVVASAHIAALAG